MDPAQLHSWAITPLDQHYAQWQTLSAVLAACHYKLYVVAPGQLDVFVPPNDQAGAPFQTRSPLVHPALHTTHGPVVLKLLSHAELGTYRRLASPAPESHILPLLSLLELFEQGQGIVLGMLPRWGDPVGQPWFGCVQDALQFVKQALEAVRALHERYVAHRDINPRNFLSPPPQAPMPSGTPAPTTQPYKLIDFENAVHLAPPTSPFLLSESAPGRPAFHAPEIERTNTYNVFAADVWALGKVFDVLLGHAEIPGLRNVVEAMLDPDPRTRVDVRVAIRSFREMEGGLPGEARGMRVPELKHQVGSGEMELD